MQRMSMALVLASLCVALAGCGSTDNPMGPGGNPPPPPNIAGTWDLTLGLGLGESESGTMTIVQSEGALSGTCFIGSESGSLAGTISDTGSIAFNVTFTPMGGTCPLGESFSTTGQLETGNRRMSGITTLVDCGSSEPGTFSAEKQ